MSADGQQRLEMVTWQLSVREVDVLVETRRTLERTQRFLHGFDTGAADSIDEQVRLLDRLLGPKGSSCDIPRRSMRHPEPEGARQ